MVRGTYVDECHNEGHLRRWVVCRTHAPFAADFVLNVRQPPANLVFAKHHNHLAWKVLHDHGFTWRAGVRMFGPDVMPYFTKLADIAKGGGQLVPFARLLLAGTGDEYNQLRGPVHDALHQFALHLQANAA